MNATPCTGPIHDTGTGIPARCFSGTAMPSSTNSVVPSRTCLLYTSVFQLDDTRKVLALLRQILPVDTREGRQWWGGKVTRVLARS